MASPTPIRVPLGWAIELPLPLPGRRRGALSGSYPTHQAFPVPGAGQAGKSQHLTGFSQAPKGVRDSIGLVRVEDPRAQHKILRDIKGRDPHLWEVVSPVQPQGVMASKLNGQSPTPCTCPGLGNGDPGTRKHK